MKIRSDKPNLVQRLNRFFTLVFLVFLLSAGENTFAQLSRVAIINLADSNLIYKHIGFTIFKDKSDIFSCQFNCKIYIDRELSRILSSRYTVSSISIPNKLLSSNGGIYNPSGINNEVRLWISSLKNQYDFVVFVETGEQDDIMDAKKQNLRSSGLYSRGNSTKSWVAVFSTTRFTLIRTSNSEAVDYDWSAMDYILPIKDYQFSRADLLIDPEMLPLIKMELIKLIDYKMQYFLTNTFLIPDVDSDGFK
jgi:hypothetical protein